MPVERDDINGFTHAAVPAEDTFQNWEATTAGTTGSCRNRARDVPGAKVSLMRVLLQYWTLSGARRLGHAGSHTTGWSLHDPELHWVQKGRTNTSEEGTRWGKEGKPGFVVVNESCKCK